MLSTTSTAVNLLPDFSFTLAVSLESSGVIWCRISIWLPSHNTVKASYCDSLTKCSLHLAPQSSAISSVTSFHLGRKGPINFRAASSVTVRPPSVCFCVCPFPLTAAAAAAARSPNAFTFLRLKKLSFARWTVGVVRRGVRAKFHGKQAKNERASERATRRGSNE